MNLIDHKIYSYDNNSDFVNISDVYKGVKVKLF